MAVADLRPMSLGEILDRTFTLYRNHFLVFVGIMAVPYLFQLVLNLSNQFLQASTAASQTTAQADLITGAAMLAVFGGLLLFALSYGVAQGAAAFAVSRLQTEQAASVRESYGQVKGRMWRAILLMLGILIRATGVFLLVMVPVLMLVGFVAALGSNPMAAVIVVPIAMVLLVFPAVVFLLCRYSLAIPVAMLEDIKARPAIRRSIVLVKGSYGRVFLVILLYVILSYVAMTVFQLPFLIALVAAGADGQQPTWLLVLSSVSAFIGSTLVGPIWPIAATLIYYDERIRKEALDLQLMMQSLTGVAPSPGSAPPAPEGDSIAVPRQFS